MPRELGEGENGTIEAEYEKMDGSMQYQENRVREEETVLLKLNGTI